VAKGLVPAAIGPGGGRVKLNSAREGTGGGDFLDLNISQTVGGNQEQTSITSEEGRNNLEEAIGLFLETAFGKK
jgi:hypothetical protein